MRFMDGASKNAEAIVGTATLGRKDWDGIADVARRCPGRSSYKARP